MAEQEHQGSSMRMGAGLVLMLLGIFVFFGTIPLTIYNSGESHCFLATFFLGFFGAFALIVAGVWLFHRAQQEEDGRDTGPFGTMFPRAGAPSSRQGEHLPPQVIVQNIGEYIAGSKVDITDSVVLRSQLGNESPPDADSFDRMMVLEAYRKLLREVLEDGQLSIQELEFLKNVREKKSISMDEHRRIEEEVLREMTNA